MLGFGFAAGAGGDVGGEDDARVRPQRRVGGQGLGLHHVEQGAVDVAAVKRGDQVGRVQLRATACVDQLRTAWQLRKKRCVQNAPGGGRVGQQANQDLAVVEESGQLIGAAKAGHAVYLLAGLRPAAHGITHGLQLARHGAAQGAQAQNANGGVAGGAGRVELLPAVLARLGQGTCQVFLQHQGRHQAKLGHALLRLGRDHAHHRQVRRQQWVGQDMFHPGGRAQDGFELRKPR